MNFREGTSNPVCSTCGINHIPLKCCPMKILSKIALSMRSMGCIFKLLSLVRHDAPKHIQTRLLKQKVHMHALPAASKHLILQAYRLVMCAHVCTYVCVHVCGCRCLFGLGKQGGGWVNGQRAWLELKELTLCSWHSVRFPAWPCISHLFCHAPQSSSPATTPSFQ